MKYELFRKDFEVWKDCIYILPTFKVVVNNRIYDRKNLAFEFHFLIWHCRLLWCRKGGVE